MALWTAAEAVAATGGVATRDFSATGVSIDTRSLQPGDLFVALKDQRDGHEFVAAALAKGAAAALVSHRPPGVAEDAPLLIVPDVLAALTALGRAGRARSSARVIGVTGSVGKTSTKDMLAAVLAGQGRCHAAFGSYNNHWGVPLTLARLPQDADFAVIEIGMNHPGEIAPLARLAAPHVALITHVAAAHLAAFDGVEAIAQEKAAIFEGLAPGGTAIFRADLAVSGILAAKAAAQKAKALTFAPTPPAAYWLGHLQVGEAATVAEMHHGTAPPLLFKIAAPGAHFALNALGVLAVAEALGLDPALAAQALGRWQPPPGRGTRQRVMLDPVEGLFFDLLDDAFNANPASMAASFATLAALQPVEGIGRLHKGRRIAILGDMLELGPEEAALHEALADLPGFARIDVVHCIGPRMAALYARLAPPQRGEWAESAAALLPRLRHLVDAGDIVLVKGSKGSRLSEVVDGLGKLGQGQAAQGEGAE